MEFIKKKNVYFILVGRLAAAAGEHIVFDSHTEGGWTWEMHSTSQVMGTKKKSLAKKMKNKC